MSEEQDTQVAERQPDQTPAKPQGGTPFIPTDAEGAMRLSRTLASSTMVPKSLQGDPQAILLIVLDALSQGRNPFQHVRTRYVIHGQVGITGQGLIAEANASGRFKGVLKFRFEGQGMDTSVTCYAVEAESGETLEYSFSLAEAQQAGFTKNKLYDQLPKQMLAYKAAAMFCRLYAPDIVAGLYTEDELPMIAAAQRDESDTPIMREIRAKAAGEEPPSQPEEPQETVFVPPNKVDNLVAAFGKVGMDRAAVEEDYGPLDQMTYETFARARKTGEAMMRDKAADEAPI